MKDSKPAAGALICSCIFLLGEAGEFVKHTSSCWIHAAICAEQLEGPVHATDSSTINIVGPSTST